MQISSGYIYWNKEKVEMQFNKVYKYYLLIFYIRMKLVINSLKMYNKVCHWQEYFGSILSIEPAIETTMHHRSFYYSISFSLNDIPKYASRPNFM